MTVQQPLLDFGAQHVGLKRFEHDVVDPALPEFVQVQRVDVGGEPQNQHITRRARQFLPDDAGRGNAIHHRHHHVHQHQIKDLLTQSGHRLLAILHFGNLAVRPGMLQHLANQQAIDGMVVGDEKTPGQLRV